MPRRHIGDGPSPCLLGQILLILAERVQSAPLSRNGAGATAGELGDLLGLSAAQVRTCTADLARARCVRVSRMPVERRNESGRYAQAFSLPSRMEERGPARASRLHPVALLIEPEPRAADRAGHVLRELSMLPMAVETIDQALTLLDHLGFDLVLVNVPPDGAAYLAAMDRLRAAAAQAGCGPLLVIGDSDMALAAPLRAHAVLASADDPRELRSALSDVLDRSRAGPVTSSPASVFGPI
jgi:hypothetical protein